MASLGCLQGYSALHLLSAVMDMLALPQVLADQGITHR